MKFYCGNTTGPLVVEMGRGGITDVKNDEVGPKTKLVVEKITKPKPEPKTVRMKHGHTRTKLIRSLSSSPKLDDTYAAGSSLTVLHERPVVVHLGGGLQMVPAVRPETGLRLGDHCGARRAGEARKEGPPLVAGRQVLTLRGAAGSELL